MKSRAMEAAAMRTPGDARALGLCSTCNSVDICTSRRNWSGPVHYCEEFDDHVETQARSERPVAMARDAPEPEITSGLSGLCVNCNHRVTCAFPKAEGGVWHCNEYE